MDRPTAPRINDQFTVAMLNAASMRAERIEKKGQKRFRLNAHKVR